MEEEMLCGGVKIKQEEQEVVEEAFNDITGQEEMIPDELIQNEIIKDETLFDDGGDMLGDRAPKEEGNYIEDRALQFQSLLEKYTQMRKTGSKNRWLLFKSGLVRKKKPLPTKRNGTAKSIIQRSKNRKGGKLSGKTNKDGQLQRRRLKQPKQEHTEVEDTSVASQVANISVNSDEMMYCDECCRLWEGDCPEHGPLLIVKDTSFPEDIDDKNRAEKTAPPQVSISNSEAESGVWALEVIPARTRFGPYEGKIVPPEICTAYSWLIRKDGLPDHYIEATEPSLSNWMRFVNCARHNGQQNLHAFQYQGRLYYRTVRAVDPGEELLVWFDEEYGRQLGTDREFGVANNYLDVCPDCPYPCASPMYLLEHKKLSHGELGASRKPANKEVENNNMSDRDRRRYNRSAKTSVSYREDPDYNLSNHNSSGIDINVNNLMPTTNPETGERCYACPECNKLILRRSHLKRHLLIHSDVKPFICEFCNKGFTRKDNFDSHVKLRHAEEVVPVANSRKSPSPQIPVKENKPRLSPRGHLSRRQQALVGEKQFVCNQCNLRFSRAEEVEAHMSVHVREKPFICSQCSKRFINKSGLVTHQKYHKAQINMAVNQNNSSPRKVKFNLALMCRVCGLQCRSLEHLTTHEHTHEDRFSKCFVCGKKFSHVNHLKRHLLIHAGYRPHGCPYCEQTFSRTEHLKRHIRTHTRQGAYECSKCKKRFAKKIVFDRHVRLHNEDAPCLLDQRLCVNFNLQKQLESYINEDDDYDQGEDGCDEIKQEVEDCEEELEDEEPLLNVFPEVILGAEN